MQKPHIPHPTPTQKASAWRYVFNSWWLVLLFFVAIASLFINREVPFERTWHAPPIGPFIHLYNSTVKAHYPIMLHEIADRPLWSYLALWLYLIFGSMVIDFAVLRLQSVLVKLTGLSANLRNLLKSRVQDRKLMIFTRWIARLGIVLTGATWIGVTPGFMSLITEVFKAAIGLYLTWWAVQLVHGIVEHWQHNMDDADARETKHVFHFIDKAAKIVVVLIMALLVANNLGLNIASVLAPASLFSIGISYGAQESVADLFGALTIFLDKPFRVGELVRIDALEGSVESIGLRSTRIWDLKGCLVTLPNRNVAKATITILPQGQEKPEPK